MFRKTLVEVRVRVLDAVMFSIPVFVDVGSTPVSVHSVCSVIVQEASDVGFEPVQGGETEYTDGLAEVVEFAV